MAWLLICREYTLSSTFFVLVVLSTEVVDDDEIIEYTTDPELIKEKWNNLVELVIKGGYWDNEPSTIIDMSSDEPSVIREGKGTLDIL